MKNNILIIVCIILLSTLCSCHKSTSNNPIVKSEFPTTVGSWWKYQQLNSNNVVVDTITITIVDTLTSSNRIVQRWVQTNSRYPRTDTMYVINTDTSISISGFPIFFPITENKIWTTPVQGTTYTTQFQDITVNNISYSGAAYLNQSSPVVFGYSTNESFWIVKNVGIVKHIIAGAGSPYMHNELISFHIM